MQIKNAVVFVTGANRGLGLAFAREAVARGAAKVYAGVRNPDAFNEPGITPVRIDVTDQASVEAAVKLASDTTLLVNNAGIAQVADGALAEAVDAQSRHIFETNYYGVIRTTQAFAAGLPDGGTGGIINVLSDASWRPVPALTAYAASKSAAWSYTNHTRLGLKDRNIQVLGLHVGYIDTDLTKGLEAPKSSPDEVVRQTYDALEAGRSEVLADVGTRAMKQSLSAELPGYIDPSVAV